MWKQSVMSLMVSFPFLDHTQASASLSVSVVKFSFLWEQIVFAVILDFVILLYMIQELFLYNDATSCSLII